jgi:hypothetical protein
MGGWDGELWGWEAAEAAAAKEAWKWEGSVEGWPWLLGVGGGVLVGAGLAVLITVVCLCVHEAKLDKERARFLDTRIAQFVDKARALEDPPTAEDIDDKVLPDDKN